jgi:penicillin-binding protein 2
VLGASGLRTQYRSVLIQGEDLRTTLDGPLQRVADRALRNTLALNHGARQASLVAMDPRTGAIEAIGSAGAGSAHIDGTVQTASPPGATFDPITGLGALSSGRWTGSRRFGDTAGTFCTGRGVSRQCRSGQAFLPTAVSTALSVESDLFMYRLGAVMNVPAAGHPLGGPLQSSARSLGLGHRPEVDLPAAAAGLLPTPAWRARLNAAGRADGRPWSLGDELSLAVGQGNVAVTPLQLAVAYAGLETGITPLRPHLGDAAVGTGKPRLVHGCALLARVPVAASTFPPIRAGLRGVVSFPEGSPRMCCAR